MHDLLPYKQLLVLFIQQHVMIEISTHLCASYHKINKTTATEGKQTPAEASLPPVTSLASQEFSKFSIQELDVR